METYRKAPPMTQTDPTPYRPKRGAAIVTGLALITALAAGIASQPGISGSEQPQNVRPVQKTTFNTNAPVRPGNGETRALTNEERNASFITTIHSAKPETFTIPDDQAINLARTTCSAFTASATYPDVEAAVLKSDIPDALGTYLINASVAVYCPEFSDLLPR